MRWMGKLVLAGALAVQAFALAGQAAAGNFMPTGGRASQPMGHHEFCQRLPAECQKTSAPHHPVTLTRELWATIIEVNNHVNTTIIPMTDMEIWGREEVWSFPDGVGDCEDYALEKRRLLQAMGVPASNLLMTVVRQKNGDGHAVLTVRTSMGDFILDNLEPRVLAWDETDYRLLKRQSERHAGVWIAIEDGRDVLVGSLK
jgi:predicted transglutaminase-like cysteine proteinase